MILAVSKSHTSPCLCTGGPSSIVTVINWKEKGLKRPDLRGMGECEPDISPWRVSVCEKNKNYADSKNYSPR